MSGTAGAEDVLERLRTVVAEVGEALGPAVAPAAAGPVVGPLALACAAERPDAPERALLLESVLEGYLLHYGRARLVETGDEDLRLLAGDHLYAVGLSRLARLGDLDAVRALADLITLCARAHADRAGAAAGERAAALWLLAVLAVCSGRWPGYDSAIRSAHGGAAATADLLAEGGRRATALGLELEAKAALIAFEAAVQDRPHA